MPEALEHLRRLSSDVRIMHLSLVSPAPRCCCRHCYCLCGEWGHGRRAVLCRARHEGWPDRSAPEACMLLVWIDALLLLLCLADLLFFSSGVLSARGRFRCIHHQKWGAWWPGNPSLPPGLPVPIGYPLVIQVALALCSRTKNGMRHNPFFFGALK